MNQMATATVFPKLQCFPMARKQLVAIVRGGVSGEPELEHERGKTALNRIES